MAITARLVDSKIEWEEFVVSHTEANFLQSWMWGDVNERLNKKVYRQGYYDDRKLVGVMIAVVEPARRGRYLSVAAGPIIDWSDSVLVDAWKDSLIAIAKAEDCVFIRVRPQLLALDEHEQLISKLGFKKAKMHLEAELTSQLELDASLDDIRSNFRKNTNREIKRAKKLGITISTTDDPTAIEDFYKIQLATAKRHGFVPFSRDRLFYEFDSFASAGDALLYSAYSQAGQLIAQAFVIFYGTEASYHYGASTELAHKLPGAYLIQWKIIAEAKRRGCQRYNFWGVVRPDDTKHRFYGVSVFKRGFRGQDIEYLHAHDLVINNIRYIKNYLIETLRKKARRL